MAEENGVSQRAVRHGYQIETAVLPSGHSTISATFDGPPGTESVQFIDVKLSPSQANALYLALGMVVADPATQVDSDD